MTHLVLAMLPLIPLPRIFEANPRIMFLYCRNIIEDIIHHVPCLPHEGLWGDFFFLTSWLVRNKIFVFVFLSNGCAFLLRYCTSYLAVDSYLPLSLGCSETHRHPDTWHVLTVGSFVNQRNSWLSSIFLPEAEICSGLPIIRFPVFPSSAGKRLPFLAPYAGRVQFWPMIDK